MTAASIRGLRKRYRAQEPGIDVNHASATGQGLNQMAITGFDRQSGADVFMPAGCQQMVGHNAGQAARTGETQPETPGAGAKKPTTTCRLVQPVDAERAYQQIQETRADYHDLAGIAKEVHPLLQTSKSTWRNRWLSGWKNGLKRLKKSRNPKRLPT